jgi:type VI secretion system FHA domain protein
MPLILTIAGNEAAELGPNAVKTFDRVGGVVGRGSQADWILPDASSLRMSQRHVRVDYRDGKYFVTDLSRNGTFLNGNDIPIGPEVTVPLSDGDVIEIAHYRIEARIRETEDPLPASPREIGDDPDAFGPARPADRAGGAPSGISDDEELDPLAWLPGGESPPKAPRRGAVPDHSPLTAHAIDHMPTHAWEPPPGGESGIPENWNPLETPGSGARPRDAPSPPARPPAGSTKSRSVIPDNWDPFGGSGKADAPPADIPDEGMEAGGTPTAPSPPHARETAGRPDAGAAADARPPSPTAGEAGTEAPVQGGPYTGTPAGDRATLVAFLRGCGVDESALGRLSPEEFMELVGRLFRNTVRDIRDLLTARANVKSGFRLDLTMIQPRENNPLKFSVGDESEMIRNLFDTRGGGYLDAESAFSEAFRDIQAHQIGVLRGMRAAFDGVLDRFDPARIERETRIRGIAFSRKALLWDAYMESYPDIAREVKDGDWLLSNPDFQKGYSRPEDER